MKLAVSMGNLSGARGTIDPRYVLAAETPEALAAVLARWMDEPEERRRMGAAAAELAARRFDARHVAADVEVVLEALR